MPVAMIYKDDGPVSLECTTEAVADCLRDAGWDVVYVGPKERVRALSAEVLRQVDLYVQPGGGDDYDEAWAVMSHSKPAVRSYVSGGGRFLGICLGAYMADSGFELLPGDAEEYIKTRGAEVKHTKDAVVNLTWRGQARKCYYQYGPSFKVKAGAPGVEVLATYSNGQAAALVAPFGSGAMGVVGPHPEASADWYTENGLNPSACEDLIIDLVDSIMAFGGGKHKAGHASESKSAGDGGGKQKAGHASGSKSGGDSKSGADHRHGRRQEEEEEEDDDDDDDDDEEDDDDDDGK